MLLKTGSAVQSILPAASIVIRAHAKRLSRPTAGRTRCISHNAAARLAPAGSNSKEPRARTPMWRGLLAGTEAPTREFSEVAPACATKPLRTSAADRACPCSFARAALRTNPAAPLAAAPAAFLRLYRQGAIPAGPTVVVMLTGSGLKTTDKIGRHFATEVGAPA